MLLQFLNVPDILLCFNSPLPPMRTRLQHLDLFLFLQHTYPRTEYLFNTFKCTMHNIFSFTLGCIVGMFCSSILPSHHPHLLLWLSGCDIQRGENFYSNHGRPCTMQGMSNEKRRHSHGRNAKTSCTRTFLATQATVQPHFRFFANHRQRQKQDLFSRFINLYTAMKMLHYFFSPFKSQE
jgi:hypothetical protein